MTSGTYQNDTSRGSASAGLSQALLLLGTLMLMGAGFAFTFLCLDRKQCDPGLGAAGVFSLLIGVAVFTWRAKILKHSPPPAKPQVLKAQQKLYQGMLEAQQWRNYNGAITLLEEAYSMNPNHQHIIHQLGAAYGQAERYDEGIVFLEKILQLHPDDYPSMHLLGYCYCQAGRYDESITVLQKVPETSEAFLKALAVLGECFYRQEQYEIAISTLKRAPLRKQALDEDLLAVHYLLGLCYEAQGEPEQALEHFTRVYAHNVEYREVKAKVEGRGTCSSVPGEAG